MDIAHIRLLLRLHPRGAQELDEGTNVRDDLEVAATALDDLWDQRDLLLDNTMPDKVVALLERWEAVYGIFRVGSRTDEQRQARLLAFRRRVPDLNPATIDDICEMISGVDCTIVEPGPFRTDDPNSLTDTEDDVVDGAFLFWVVIDQADATAVGLDRDELQEVVDDIKRATRIGQVRFDDFRTDDPYSLTDIDLLGA